MAERSEDPVERDVIRQQAEMAHLEQGEPSLLRIQSGKSARGEDIQWTEEVPNDSPFDSSETIVGEKVGVANVDRGKDKDFRAERSRSDRF